MFIDEPERLFFCFGLTFETPFGVRPRPHIVTGVGLRKFDDSNILQIRFSDVSGRRVSRLDVIKKAELGFSKNYRRSYLVSCKIERIRQDESRTTVKSIENVPRT